VSRFSGKWRRKLRWKETHERSFNYGAQDIFSRRESCHFKKQILAADIREKHRVHPNWFYQWKKDLFEKATELLEENLVNKVQWGDLTHRHIPRTLRNGILNYIAHWHKRTKIALGVLLLWAFIKPGKYHNWNQRRDVENRYNA